MIRSLVFFIAMMMIVSMVWANDADSLAIRPLPLAVSADSPEPPSSVLHAADTADTLVAGPMPLAALDDSSALAVPAEPRPPISYGGLGLSAVIPGAGQVYHKRYVMGVGFLAADVIAGSMASYWWSEYHKCLDDFQFLKDSSAVLRRSAAGDSAILYGAGEYSVLADRREFEARLAKYTAYNAFSWTVGIYYYNLMDALERGGVTHRGKAKDPLTAGLLAAVPFFGLGQLYNERPGKAGMISMAQASFAVIAINHHHAMEFASEKYNEMRDPDSEQFAHRADHLAHWKSRYDQEFSRRNTYLWISLFVYLYNIFDAVVDAHLSDYSERVRFGPDLTVGTDGVVGAGLQLRVDF